MKRKVLMTMMLCASLAVASAAVNAEEAATEAATEAVTETATEAVTEETTEVVTEEATEEETEAASEETTETETEAACDPKDLQAYTASDYITLGEYKGIEVEVPAATATDDEILAVIEQRTITTVTTGEVEEGDVANIDYVGKKDDVAFDGGTASGYDLTIGSGTFIEGFEEGLIGKEIGSTVDLNLTFPENYGNADLAGAEVVFTVTINSVQRPQELTDEVAATLAEGMTAEAYKESVRNEIIEEKQAENRTTAEQELLAKLVEASEIASYPEANLEYTINRAKDYYAYVASYYGLSLDDYISVYGLTNEDFMEQLKPIAESALGQEMALLALFDAEAMELTEEEYQEGIETYAASQYITADYLEETYGKDYLSGSLKQEKALNFLYDNAVITEVEE